jgi:1,2-diacylglycerol 3-alpha-glucosyltransferase
MTKPRVALLCSGLGRVHRGHEVFARDLFSALRDDLDITLFKSAGEASDRERVIPCVPRDAPSLAGMQLAASPKWHDAAVEVERMRVEGETFAWAALGPLLDGCFDVLHCLEQEVCKVLWSQRHLFERTPRLLWSNGGALPAADIPPCDTVQEHTEYNLARSAKNKAFCIPHGVDLQRFHPGVTSTFRQQHGIPDDAFVVLSVGTICYWHKRMDHVIRETAQVPGAWLVIVGQEGPDTPEIKALGQELMAGRIVFATMPHDRLPEAYAAADVFVLGSLFETFGIVYIEAMAMGLPVVCTHHPNQRGIVNEGGVFIDMEKAGALTAVLRDTPRADWAALGQRGLQAARERFDWARLKQQYVERYATIASTPVRLPRYTLATKVAANAADVWRRAARLWA